MEIEERSPYKKPSTAAMLSLLFPGLGQIYIGEVGKGVIFIVICLVVGAFQLSVGMLSRVSVYLLFAQLILSIWLAWDGYETTKRMNAGEAMNSPSVLAQR
jgi:TM2 domain-containing membrane protein YozV